MLYKLDLLYMYRLKKSPWFNYRCFLIWCTPLNWYDGLFFRSLPVPLFRYTVSFFFFAFSLLSPYGFHLLLYLLCFSPPVIEVVFSVQTRMRKVHGQHHPLQPPLLLLQLLLNRKVMASPTISAVCSVGRKMRNWEICLPSLLYYMLTWTSLVSNRTTLVSIKLTFECVNSTLN